MLFVTVRSASAAEVPKVLRVVEETKRLRHKSGIFFSLLEPFSLIDEIVLGIADEEELHQYVTYDNASNSARSEPRPRRIKLDDPSPVRGASQGPKEYTAPNSLMVHLSKIDMPELRPKAEVDEDLARKKAWEKQWARMQVEAAATSAADGRFLPETVLEAGPMKGKDKSKEDKGRGQAKEDRGKGKEDKGKAKEKGKERERERERAQKEKEKLMERDRKIAEKEQKKLNKKRTRSFLYIIFQVHYIHQPSAPSTSPPKSPTRPPAGLSNSFPPSQAHSHIPPHQSHPYQPTPSPSQLNNPSIYAAPPPARPPRTSFYGSPQGNGGPPWEAPSAPGSLAIPAAVPRVRSVPGSPEQGAARTSRIFGRW